MQSELKRAETKGFLKNLGEGESIGHLCFLIDFTQRKSKLFLIFMTGGSFTTWMKVPP